jgi:hypothetical protein
VRVTRSVCLVASLAWMLVGCGSDPGNPPTASMTSASASTARLETTSTTLPAEPGPSTLITVDGGNLVALDLATGSGIVLAGHHELAASLGLAEGRFEGVDLSPDGSVVAFAFGGWEGDHGAALLAVNEQTERVACWVEHDAKTRAVTVRWLNQCLVASQLANKLNGCLEVIHEDFEVHHLRLVSGLFGPDRRLVGVVCLDVQADAALRIAELQPANAVASSDFPAEQL